MKRFKELLFEGRPKLIKFLIKKNNVKWSVKNVDASKVYYIKINEDDAEGNMHAFLESITAYDEITLPRTDRVVNRRSMAKEVIKKGTMVIWVPENRIHFIKDTWNYS